MSTDSSPLHLWLIRVCDLNLNPQWGTPKLLYAILKEQIHSSKTIGCLRVGIILPHSEWFGDQEKKNTYLDTAIRKNIRKHARQGGSEKFFLFWVWRRASRYEDCVNKMKFDCHFPSYVSCVLLFKSFFPVKRVLIRYPVQICKVMTVAG